MGMSVRVCSSELALTAHSRLSRARELLGHWSVSKPWLSAHCGSSCPKPEKRVPHTTVRPHDSWQPLACTSLEDRRASARKYRRLLGTECLSLLCSRRRPVTRMEDACPANWSIDAFKNG